MHFVSILVSLLLQTPTGVRAEPLSRPFVPFRTSPYDQSHLHHNLTWTTTDRNIFPRLYQPKNDKSEENSKCPLQFTLGLSRRSHVEAMSIIEPPVIYPVHPSRGPGRQVIHTTQYEYLDLLSPAKIPLDSVIKEGLVQQEDFPLLFESSAFLASPIIHDVNGDGIVDAILADYDGGIYMVGLQVKEGSKRFFRRGQVPRLHIRKEWMTHRLNETIHGPKPAAVEGGNRYDPYHSYFEYVYNTGDASILQGVTANVLGQESADLKQLEERRSRRAKPKDENMESKQQVGETEAETSHRRLQEVDQEPFERHGDEQHVEVITDGEQGEAGHIAEGEAPVAREDLTQVMHEPESHELVEEIRMPDETERAHHDEVDEQHHEREEQKNYETGGSHDGSRDGSHDEKDDDFERARGGEEKAAADDDAPKGVHHDDAYPHRDFGYDDYYAEERVARSDYYEGKHYNRVPPHILCSPVLVELPKLYTQIENEMEEMLFVAVSYFIDEDEHEGFFSYKRFEAEDSIDTSEAQRGMFVASAIMVFQLGDSMRWGKQEHLDLSGDPTAPQNATLVQSFPIISHHNKMGAFALSSPTVADIDGDGNFDILIGTSMGIVYGLDARHMYKKDGWPVQMKHAVESRILVEDVVGDTNLEIFVADVGGNVVCLDKQGNVIWHRDLLTEIANNGHLQGSSPMTLGDVDGDGLIDVTIVLEIELSTGEQRFFVVVISAATGNDIANFPLAIASKPPAKDDSYDEIHRKLPQPLLVDLHADQTRWKSHLYRNGTKAVPTMDQTKIAPHGGSAPGLHIIQPIGSELFIIEGGSGCVQTISIGEEVTAMVQADDVHGTGSLDLVISTASGNIVTLESPVVPYHPLNVWNNGGTRGRFNSFAHGFSASQGIFVHDVSRRYRDIFGVYIPVTFEIFDHRPNIENEPTKRIYKVELRDGTSSKRVVLRKTYNVTGIYTERVFMPYGPGYYTISVVMKTSHGLTYEDTFHLGYNVHYLEGFGLLLWLPLVLAAGSIIACGRRRLTWEDDDFEEGERGRGLGILGRVPS